MILNLWTNFEFSSLWNYHFTFYALKCKKSKINGCKMGCQHYHMSLFFEREITTSNVSFILTLKLYMFKWIVLNNLYFLSLFNANVNQVQCMVHSTSFLTCIYGCLWMLYISIKEKNVFYYKCGVKVIEWGYWRHE